MSVSASLRRHDSEPMGSEVHVEAYAPGLGMPLFITPARADLRSDPDAAIAWLRERQETIDDLLCEVGAIVLREFAFNNTDVFSRAVEHYPEMPFGYIGGATPRASIRGRAYEATRVPPQFKLQLHQEMAYLPRFPSKLAFYCNAAPDTGGETLIADVRRFDEGLPRDFRDEVKRRGVRYVRNFRAPDWLCGDAELDASHLVWHDVFGTTDRATAEASCRAMGLDCRWAANGSLSIGYTASGFTTHPRTGREIWFNHILSQSPNPWTDSPNQLERIAEFQHLYGDEAPPPYATTFGDGGRIAIEQLKPMYELAASIEVAFSWQAGDLMLLDNFYAFHGRNSYVGHRDVQVALLG